MVETVEVIEEVKEVKTFPKRIQCPRCKGSGTWVSSRTGIRAQTAGDELAVDASRQCPRCKGVGTLVIRISEEQAKAEMEKRKQAKAKIESDKRVAKGKIDNQAAADKKAVDQS